MQPLSTLATLLALAASCFADCPRTITSIETADVVAVSTVTSYAATQQLVTVSSLPEVTSSVVITESSFAVVTTNINNGPKTPTLIVTTITVSVPSDYIRVQDSIPQAEYTPRSTTQFFTFPGASTSTQSLILRARATDSPSGYCASTVITCSTTTRTCTTYTETVTNTTPIDFYVVNGTTIASPLYTQPPPITTTVTTTTTTASTSTSTQYFAVDNPEIAIPYYDACDTRNLANYVNLGNGQTRSIGTIKGQPDLGLADDPDPVNCCKLAFRQHAAAWMLESSTCWLFGVRGPRSYCPTQNATFSLEYDGSFSDAIVGNGPCGQLTL